MRRVTTKKATQARNRTKFPIRVRWASASVSALFYACCRVAQGDDMGRIFGAESAEQPKCNKPLEPAQPPGLFRETAPQACSSRGNTGGKFPLQPNDHAPRLSDNNSSPVFRFDRIHWPALPVASYLFNTRVLLVWR